MATITRTKDIPKAEIPDYYYREFKLPYADQGEPNGISEVQKNGETVAIVDVRGNGFVDIYDIYAGELRRIEFKTT